MRIIVILVCLSAGMFLVYKKIFGDGGPEGFLASGSTGILEKNKPLTPSDSSASAFVPENSSVSGSSSEKDIPKASRMYRFQYRKPVLGESVTLSASQNCVVTTDLVSRVAFVSGPPAGVEMVIRYLESIDVPSSSCAVQAWAVYVDQSAQKGWDLVAAIGAVADIDTRMIIGNGGMTLDIGADSLTAALNTIADGTVVEVIQRPHVHLEQGEIAKIESIQEIPIPSTTVSQGVSQTSVEYRKVGLQLEVVPYFLGNERVRLGVTQTNGLLGANVRIGSDEVPIIQSQTVSSSVELSVGQAVVLGGVTTLRKTVDVGLLRNVEKISQGTLYVVLSTSSNVPKAVPVIPALQAASINQIPLGLPVDDPQTFIMDALLPEKNWQLLKPSTWFDRQHHVLK